MTKSSIPATNANNYVSGKLQSVLAFEETALYCMLQRPEAATVCNAINMKHHALYT